MEKKDETEIGIIIDDDEKLKIFGELLSNQTSRDLIRFLMSESSYKKKISDELGVKYSLVEHHLKKLENLGLVEITNKKIIKKGVFHKNYKINSEGIFISLNLKRKKGEKEILKKIFKSGVKFVAIGVAAILSFKITEPYEITHKITIPTESQSDITHFNLDQINGTASYVTTKIIVGDVLSQFLITGIIISLGVFLIIISKKKKKG